MGDRAVVRFTDGDEFSCDVYLHWDGYRVMELIRGAADRFRRGDVPYSTARFIGYCHEQIPGNLSLGVYAPGTFDYEDSRILVVDVMTGDVVGDTDKVIAGVIANVLEYFKNI